MSLVFQMISAGNGLTAPSSPAIVAPGVNAAGTGSLLPFAQTLIQMMTGTAVAANSSAASADPMALLQGLLKEMQPTGEGEEKTASQGAELLAALTKDIEKLDESIPNDPALLAALQGWLLQVAALLPGDVQQEQEGETEGSAHLSPLAQNSETLRFAVQDDLNRLVSIIQEAASGGDETLTTKGLTLLNQFTGLMTEAAAHADKTKTPVQLHHSTTEAITVKAEKVPVSSVNTSAASGDSHSDLTGSLESKGTLAVEVKKVASEEETSTAFTVPAEDHEVVTAGQLSLRNGINTPLKAEAPPVPVQQFAKEMTGLITSKLEIVNKGGVAEATISLFPDNLGQVDVKITMQNGHLVAQFVTEHAGAKDLLEQQMVQLRSALQSQGLQVEKLEVTQNNTPLQSQMQQERRQSGTGGQQAGGRSKERDEANSDAVTAAELNGEWKDWLVNGSTDNQGQSGSFSVKA